jgi:hypothetical protein
LRSFAVALAMRPDNDLRKYAREPVTEVAGGKIHFDLAGNGRVLRCRGFAGSR